MFSREQLTDLHENFPTVSKTGTGFLPRSDVQKALKILEIDIPGYKMRELLDKQFGLKEQIDMNQFTKLWEMLDAQKNEDVNRWKQQTKQVSGAYHTHSPKQEDVQHTIRVEEEVAFLNWINSNLSDDSDLKQFLPVNPQGGELYKKVQDGLIICKLINLAVPGTIDERAINKKNLNIYTKLENLTLALMSSQAIGCNITNIDSINLNKGTAHLVLGLLWQIIRIGLFNQIDLQHCPGLFRLLRNGETLDDLQRLSPEEILIRWVNYHLDRSGTQRRLYNFTSNIVDSEIYTHLLNQIAPVGSGVTLSPLGVQGNHSRAVAMLDEAQKLDCREFVTAMDVAAGNYKLNLAFVANLFNKNPNLPNPDADEIVDDVVEETLEEKTYRNWMNSMGVDPYVNWLYGDLQNGIVIFQLYDIIRPGIVTWKRVVRSSDKLRVVMTQIQNCNYAIELGKQLGFSLVGIQGKDLYDGNRTLTLALVWQLVRAYTLSVLAQCTHSKDSLPSDNDIIGWVNKKLAESGKQTSIRSFQDPAISNGIVILDLIDSIKPNVIDHSLINIGVSNENKISNAKYAITCGRKIGAKIYALPEHIVEVHRWMVMTVFACLMACDYTPDMKECTAPITPNMNRN